MATDWEQRYQTGDTPWDKGEAHPGLVAFLDSRPLKGRVLVPGCGFGYDVRAITGIGNHVTGLDVAPSAIQRARKFPRKAGEDYLLGDLFDLPDDLRGVFDWIWEHTCFCAIDPERREEYVRATVLALKPAGYLLAMFYMDPGNDGVGPPFGVTIPELDRLFGGAFELVHEEVPARTYPNREGRELLRLYRKL